MKRILLAAAFAAAPLFHAFAQAPAQPAPQKEAIAQVRGVRVVKVGTKFGEAAGDRVVELGDDVAVDVTYLDLLEKRAHDNQVPITLFLNGRDSKLEPVSTQGPRIDRSGALTYRLDRTTDNKDLWRDLMRDPFDHETRTINISVGLKNDRPLVLTDDAKPAYVTLDKVTISDIGILWILVMLLIVIGLVYYAWTSDMLRNGAPIDGKRQAYSLARSQMAWWFALIVIGYIIIWILTGDRDSIPSSLLVLLGISAATAMGSIAIDATDRTRAADSVKEIQRQKSELESTQSKLPAAGADTTSDEARAAINTRVAEMTQSMAAIVSPRMSKRSWLMDVISDDDGTIALHRFQILAWTLVLGLIFMATVARDLSMPEFSATLLALMGISSGTYLGFKFKNA